MLFDVVINDHYVTLHQWEYKYTRHLWLHPWLWLIAGVAHRLSDLCRYLESYVDSPCHPRMALRGLLALLPVGGRHRLQVRPIPRSAVGIIAVHAHFDLFFWEQIDS
jgi:hypothetical protein